MELYCCPSLHLGMRSFYFNQMQEYEETKKPELFHINYSLFVLFLLNPAPPFKNTECRTN